MRCITCSTIPWSEFVGERLPSNSVDRHGEAVVGYSCTASLDCPHWLAEKPFSHHLLKMFYNRSYFAFQFCNHILVLVGDSFLQIVTPMVYWCHLWLLNVYNWIFLNGFVDLPQVLNHFSTRIENDLSSIQSVHHPVLRVMATVANVYGDFSCRTMGMENTLYYLSTIASNKRMKC